MSGTFGRIKQSWTNLVLVFGCNNRVVNIVNSDGTATEFKPHVDWNLKPQAGGSSAFLEWRARLTPLIGRADEIKQLLDWANEESPLSFKVIQAPGGIGKTRLAAEVAQILSKINGRNGWSAGFMSLIDFRITARMQWIGNWFIVVDYPEHSPDRLAELMRAAKASLSEERIYKLRVLLLCRTQALLDAKLYESGAKSYLSAPIELRELSEAANFELLKQALAEMAIRENRSAASILPISEAEFEAWLALSPLHNTALFVLALAIHLSSSPKVANRLLPGAQLLSHLVEREEARWRKVEHGLLIAPGTLSDVVALATIFNGLAASEINNALVAAYGWNDATRNRVFAALAEIWPADSSSAAVYPPLLPDLLAAVFLWRWQAQPSKRGNLKDTTAFLKIAGIRNADISTLLQRWHMHAYDQTMRLMLGKPADAGALALLIQDIARQDRGFKSELRRGFVAGTSWTALGDVAVLVSKPDAELGDTTELATQAHQLNRHSIALSTAGDNAGALEAARESYAIYKHLAKANPSAFEANLAASLGNLSNYLSKAGDRAGALQAAGEVLEMYRHLAKTKPAVFSGFLADSLSNYSVRLRENGDRAGALQTVREALEMYKHFAKENPAKFEPDLAMSLSNLSNCLRENGNQAGALQAMRESVDIRSRLAKANPAVFEPDFAASMTNLSFCLSDSGDYAEALHAQREALEVYKRLAKASPTKFEPDLAMSLRNLAIRLSETGDHVGALDAARDAVEIYRHLAKADPDAFDSNLGMSLSNLSNHLSEIEDRAGAVQAASEALEILSRVTKTNPGAFEPDLALCMGNLSTHLSENGDRARATVVAQDALRLYEQINIRHNGLFDKQVASSRRFLESL